MGLINYFRKFIRDYANKSKPLRDLLRKSNKFDFNVGCVKSFQDLKKELITQPVLCLYNSTAETQLHTDASAVELGAILLQKQVTGKFAPIAYYSQAINQAEAKYHSFELEMLAIVRAVGRFYIYLNGIDFTVITDCNALVHAVNKINLNSRIARWTLSLQNYKFTIKHRAGIQMAHVDALSCHISYVDALPLKRELEIKQVHDSKLLAIAKELENRENKKFTLIDGLVYRNDDRPRFVVPDSLVTNVIRAYYDEMAHWF